MTKNKELNEYDLKRASLEKGLALYEHQSSINPNMPLRDLFYLACVYSCLVRDENLFGETQIRIPEPKFVVFYNGVKEAAEKEIQQ